VGAAPATRDVVDRALAASQSEIPVLVTGPQGSGKEHISRAIHTWSAVGSGPFVVVSCGAVSASLIGRELFGCAERVYPLLPEAYPGALARAAGGTVLVDAVEGLPDAESLALQKALADRRFQRQGDGSSVSLRCRVIATTRTVPHRSPFGDLPTHTIDLLPLSERREDVLPLAAHWLRLCAQEEGVQPVGFTSDARDALLAESWPGNVRELSERVRQAIKLAGNGSISAESLMLAADAEQVPSFKEAKRAFETRYVVGLLRRCGGNISLAARLAKKDRKDFYDVIRRTGVDPAEFR
jgi:two-component system response regulator GlrR